MADAILSDANASGIYQIRNLVNGKRYIGSAKRFSKRWSVHLSNLRRGVHHSPALQSAWIKYGEGSFAFEVLLVCGFSELIANEQRFFDTCAPQYNIRTVAGSSAGAVTSDKTKALLSAAMTGRKRSAETRQRMSVSQKNRKTWPTPSVETRAKISASLKGRPRPRTQLHSQKIGIAKRKISDADIAAMSRLHKHGATLTAIARQFGCSLALVSNLKNSKKRQGSWV
jgi:group I intron endonuclease